MNDEIVDLNEPRQRALSHHEDTVSVTRCQPSQKLPWVGEFWQHTDTERVYEIMGFHHCRETLKVQIRYRGTSCAIEWSQPLSRFLEITSRADEDSASTRFSFFAKDFANARERLKERGKNG